LNIWPRGFSLDQITKDVPELENNSEHNCPIQQGLADDNPDVDAIYRLILPLPIKFKDNTNVVLGKDTCCPFNSQNTTWFKEAFPLLYLPSFCSFRMTDIWRSFVAQRVAWSCNWGILFHSSTVRQERNDHRLMKDFEDEVVGYINNSLIVENLSKLKLKDGSDNIEYNMKLCYNELVNMGLVEDKELSLLDDWFSDLEEI
jgi:hypothetical protein